MIHEEKAWEQIARQSNKLMVEQQERAERAEALRDRAQLDRDAAEVRANRAEQRVTELEAERSEGIRPPPHGEAPE